MVITNDAAIPTHLGHDSTATPVKWRYSHYVFVFACVCVKVCNIYMCVRLRVCVSVLLSIISPLQVQDFFHTPCVLLRGCNAHVCTCVFVCTTLFAQLQTQHSPLRLHTTVFTDKCTQSCKFFTNTALFNHCRQNWEFTSISFCERTRSYQSISNFQVDNLRTTICNNVTSLALFVACPDF